MIGREFHFHDGAIGAALAIRVNVSGSDNKIDRVLKDGTVIVTIKKKTVNLNGDVIAYLAEQLGIDQKRFDIIAGEESKEKIISILDIKPGELQSLILGKLS
jgi:uncharacterized protein YggU (UPF0235/DUF167 family)